MSDVALAAISVNDGIICSGGMKGRANKSLIYSLIAPDERYEVASPIS